MLRGSATAGPAAYHEDPAPETWEYSTEWQCWTGDFQCNFGEQTCEGQDFCTPTIEVHACPDWNPGCTPTEIEHLSPIEGCFAGSGMWTSGSNTCGHFDLTPPEDGNTGTVPVLAITGPGTVDEGAGTAGFTVGLSNVWNRAVTVRVTTADGSATAGSDYGSVNRTITIPAGLTTGTVAVSIIDDTTIEGDETFTMSLSNPTNATLPVTPAATATIEDNEVPRPDAIQNLVLTCARSDDSDQFGTGLFGFELTATWSPPTDTAVGMQAEFTENPDVGGWFDTRAAVTSPHTPLRADPYWGTPSNWPTAPGPYRVSVIPYLTGGNIGEATEAFAECAVPEVSINDARPVAEGAVLNYTVTRTGAATYPVTVDWATTTTGSAFAGTDYRSASGTVTFAAGETVKTVTVETLPDTNTPEPVETVVVVLSNPSGATIGRATATGFIGDVGVPPVVSLQSTSLSVAEDNTAGVQITAVLDKPASAAASVAAVASGAARGAGSCYSGVEFYLSASTFSFSVGADRASIILYPCVDADYSNETINVNLTSVGIAGLTLGSPTSTVVTITDPAPVVSFAGPVSVDEAAGSATFTVEVPAAVTSAVSVIVNTSNGTAVAGSDYTAVVNRLVTIGVGSRSATVSVTILDDATVEPDETFTVTLTNPTNATLGTVTATGTIRNDDVPPPTTVPGPGF